MAFRNWHEEKHKSGSFEHEMKNRRLQRIKRYAEASCKMTIYLVCSGEGAAICTFGPEMSNRCIVKAHGAISDSPGTNMAWIVKISIAAAYGRRDKSVFRSVLKALFLFFPVPYSTANMTMPAIVSLRSGVITRAAHAR